MVKRIDIAGQTFSRLTVKRYVGSSKWECLCSCGVVKNVDSNNLRKEIVRSCGCLRLERVAVSNTTHGLSQTPTYRIWSLMKDRCTNANNKRWADYGGRGIRFDPRWVQFENFLADMGKRPAGLTLERRNVNLGYTKTNCIWATWRAQFNNKRNTVMLTAFGETKALMDWARDPRCVVNEYTLRQRVTAYGWNHERAISSPVMQLRRKES